MPLEKYSVEGLLFYTGFLEFAGEASVAGYRTGAAGAVCGLRPAPVARHAGQAGFNPAAGQGF